jgi:2-keto-3-deoxy-L-rhamnonate aldolase RhmA
MANLKQRINQGETILGVTTIVSIERDRLEALIESGPYDFVWVDSQHSPFNEESLVGFCLMAQDMGVPVQVRLKHTSHASLAGNYVDLGPSGVEVPQVETAATVDEAIDAFYYPQAGKRSWGGVARVGIEGRSDRLEYAEWWGETGVLWVQIESVDAVTNARELAKAGVDCLSFGPADLSFSLEAHPHHPFNNVDDCVRHVVEQLRDTHATVCFRNYEPSARQKYIDMGVTVLLERPGG